jgi:hypothetical protein
MSDSNQISRIKNDKYVYCADTTRFTNDRCTKLVKSNPTQFDHIASQGCSDNYTANDSCKAFATAYTTPTTMPSTGLKQLNTCIDANNKIVPTATCFGIANDKNSPYAMNLLEPSLNYCKDPTNATTDNFCQTLLGNKVYSISTFADYDNENDKNDYYEDFINIMFLIILIVMIVSLTAKYKDKIIGHSFMSCNEV